MVQVEPEDKVKMKELLIGLFMGFILILWHTANTYHKPKLNRLSNYYEEDQEGKTIANILMAACMILSFAIGVIIYKY